MKAYKATYNLKCKTLTYEVGKTYSIDKMKICSHGFHFCKKMEDVLNYYIANDKFVLLEVEILGKTDYAGDKGVTNKMKVLRVIPKEEHKLSSEPPGVFSRWEGPQPVEEYDDRGNVIRATYASGDTYEYQYDDRNNKIAVITPLGCYIWEYDDKDNVIHYSWPNGGWTITID